jgi:hypothetical protein
MPGRTGSVRQASYGVVALSIVGNLGHRQGDMSAVPRQGGVCIEIAHNCRRGKLQIAQFD